MESHKLLEEELNLVHLGRLLSKSSEEGIELALDLGESAIFSVDSNSFVQILNIHFFPMLAVLILIQQLMLGVILVLVQTLDPGLSVSNKLFDVFESGLELDQLTDARSFSVCDIELARCSCLLAVGCSINYNIVCDLTVSVLVNENAADNVTVESNTLSE